MKAPILVVDDDQDIRDALKDVLEDAGYSVQCVRDGKEALEYLRSGSSASLILLDLAMPQMDGYEFREEQLRDPQLKEIPVVIVTAQHMASTRHRLPPASRYVSKPVRVHDLLDLLATAEQFAS